MEETPKNCLWEDRLMLSRLLLIEAKFLLEVFIIENGAAGSVQLTIVNYAFDLPVPCITYHDKYKYTKEWLGSGGGRREGGEG